MKIEFILPKHITGELKKEIEIFQIVDKTEFDYDTFEPEFFFEHGEYESRIIAIGIGFYDNILNLVGFFDVIKDRLLTEEELECIDTNAAMFIGNGIKIETVNEHGEAKSLCVSTNKKKIFIN